MTADRRLAIQLGSLAVFWLAAAWVFRDGLGLVIFLVLAIAVIIQLLRVVFLGSSRRSLKALWKALGDAFWGIG